MAEVAGAGEGHGEVAFVGGGDDFGVAHGAAGLDGGGGAGFGSGDEAVGEGEEGITTHDTSFEGEFGFAGFPNGDAAGIDAAHLTCADAEGAIGANVNDGVGFEVFDDAPAEEHAAEFLGGGLAFGDDFEIGGGGDF